MAPKVILYDLPSRQGIAWSLNPWKSRLALHYKGIEYTTEWVEYPDIAPKFRAAGVAANQEGNEYAIPVLKTEDGHLIMDSEKIAAHLEATYTSPEYPSFHLDDPSKSIVAEKSSTAFSKFRANLLPKVPRNLLNPVSAEYFQETRKKFFGKSLNDFETQEGGEIGYEASKPALQALADTIRGPYVLGDKTSYSDFYIVTFLEFVGRCDEPLLDRLFNDFPAFKTIFEAYGPYLTRKD